MCGLVIQRAAKVRWLLLAQQLLHNTCLNIDKLCIFPINALLTCSLQCSQQTAIVYCKHQNAGLHDLETVCFLWSKNRIIENYLDDFLGVFAKLRKATIGIVMSVCRSVGMEQLGSHLTDYYGILIFEFFFENVSKMQVFIKIWQEWRALYIKTNTHFWSYLAQFFLIRIMF